MIRNIAITLAFAIWIDVSVSAQSNYSITIEQTGLDAFIYTAGSFLGKTPFNDEIFLTAGEGIYIVAEGFQAVSIPYKDLKKKEIFIVSMEPIGSVDSIRSELSFDTGDIEIDLVGASPFWSTNSRITGNDNIRNRFLSFLDMEVPLNILSDHFMDGKDDVLKPTRSKFSIYATVRMFEPHSRVKQSVPNRKNDLAVLSTVDWTVVDNESKGVVFEMSSFQMFPYGGDLELGYSKQKMTESLQKLELIRDKAVESCVHEFVGSAFFQSIK